MPSRMRHGLLISLVIISLIIVSFSTSCAETTNYTYDEINRLIQVIYGDGRGVTYTYDASGNRITLTQTVDTVPPTGTIMINSGAPTTDDPSVTLTLTCIDNVGCSQMQFSNDDVTYSTPEAYGTTKSWTLSPGYGSKTVYAKFKDVAGNWSTAYSDTIDLIADLYTKTLLHLNGTDGSTTFTDSATGGSHTWAASGNAQIDTAQKKFGTASGLFDGSSDYISTPDHADWAFSTGNFTIDFWMKLNGTTTYQAICSQWPDSTNDWAVWYYGGSDKSMRISARKNAAYVMYYHGGSINDTNWHHVAWVRNGDTMLLFIDGTSQPVTAHTPFSAGASMPDVAYALWIGGYNGGTYWFNGWLDEFRISKGIARWTANFTPPTGEY